MNDASLKYIVDVLECPISGGPLEIRDGFLHSPTAGVTFPQHMGVPWIYRNPIQQVLQWRQKTKSVAEHYKDQAARAETELRKVDLLKSTHERLELLAHAYKKTARFFDDVLEHLGTQPALEVERFFLEKVPRQQALLAYSQTVYRDWAWGKSELDLQLEAVLPHLKDSRNLLILGAGACGLPAAVHEAIGHGSTLAVDINPILFYVARKVLGGGGLSLFEFPKIPLDLKHSAIEHNFQGKPPLSGFHMLFADAQTAAFKSGAFDSLLTPWLIDIVPRNFREFARHVNHALKKDGRWVNIGLLDFHRHEISELYSPEEIREALEDAGFRVEDMRQVEMPYSASPYSMVRRQDSILVFSAIKEKVAKKPAQYEYLPDWLRQWDKPVPNDPRIQNFSVKTAVFAQTVGLVDGQRNLEQIAEFVSKQFGLNTDAAREAVYNFFVNVYEQLIFREF